MLLRVLLFTFGAFGMLDTVIVSFISSMNLGVVLPGLLGLPLVLVSVFLPKLQGAGKLGQIVLVVVACGYLAALLLFGITWIIIDRQANKAASPGADALIVLGAGLRGEDPKLVLRLRMDTAIAYLKENPKTVAILSGGKGDDEQISEAEAMARYFRQKGVPASQYIKEDASTNTRENFAFSYQIIRERLGENVKLAFVTTDFHIFRSERVAARQGILIEGLAAPDVWYLSLNNHLRECAAIWVYWLTGRL